MIPKGVPSKTRGQKDVNLYSLLVFITKTHSCEYAISYLVAATDVHMSHQYHMPNA